MTEVEQAALCVLKSVNNFNKLIALLVGEDSERPVFKVVCCGLLS